MLTTTAEVALGAHDGHVVASADSTNYTTTTPWGSFMEGAEVGMYRYNDGSNNYTMTVGLFRFASALALPDDAIPTAASFKFTPSYVHSTDSLSLTADWHTWNPADLFASFTLTAQTNALASKPLNDLTALSTNTVALDNATGVSSTADTYLRLHISNLAANAPPTGDNRLLIGAYEADSSYIVPQLEITYTLPTVRMLPNEMISRVNLPRVAGATATDAEALAAIDEDPDTPDSSWMEI